MLTEITAGARSSHGRRRAGPTPPRAMWSLAILALTNSVGVAFVWPVTTIYIHDVLGRPLTVAGLVLMLYSGASFLGQLAGGILFDRVGGRPVIVVGLLGASAMIALPGLVESWPVFVAALPLYGFFESLVFPAVNALAAGSWPGAGRRAFNFIYVAQNAGVAAGTAAVGLVAGYSFRMVWLGAALLAFLAGTLALRLIRSDRGSASPVAATPSLPSGEDTRAIPWLPVAFLMFSLFFVWVIYMQWSSTLAVFMQEDAGISLAAYSFLWTLNGLIIVFGQPVISTVVRFVSSLAHQLYLGIVLYIVAFGLLLLEPQYLLYVLAMVVLTLGEMLILPGVPAAVDQLTPPSRRGFLQGSIGGATALGRMVGPLFGGVIYDSFGVTALLSVLPFLLLVPLLSFWLYSRAARGLAASQHAA